MDFNRIAADENNSVKLKECSTFWNLVPFYFCGEAVQTYQYVKHQAL